MLVPNTLSLEDIYITRRGYTIHHIPVSVSVQIYTIYRGFAFRKPDPPFHGPTLAMYGYVRVSLLLSLTLSPQPGGRVLVRECNCVCERGRERGYSTVYCEPHSLHKDTTRKIRSALTTPIRHSLVTPREY